MMLLALATGFLAFVVLLALLAVMLIVRELRARLTLVESMAHEQVACARPHSFIEHASDAADYGNTMNLYPPRPALQAATR